MNQKFMKMEFLGVLVLFLALSVNSQAINVSDNCLNDSEAEECRRNLRIGQYYCASPEVDIDSQSIASCDRISGTVEVPCFAAPNVTCGPGSLPYNQSQCIFTETRSCRYVNGQRYNYYLAVGLSLFLGMLGVDRFYLGYPAIGLMKLCTLGFFLIGHLLDFLLILVGAVGPADRTGYYAPFYGPLATRVEESAPFVTDPTSQAICAV